jgi:hypothetical protein
MVAGLFINPWLRVRNFPPLLTWEIRGDTLGLAQRMK